MNTSVWFENNEWKKASRVDGVRESERLKRKVEWDREELLMNELKISIDIFFPRPLSPSLLFGMFFVSVVHLFIHTQIFSAYFSICHICLFRILSHCSVQFCFGLLKHCFLDSDNMTQLIYCFCSFFSRNFKPLKMARIPEKNHLRQRQQHNYLNK